MSVSQMSRQDGLGEPVPMATLPIRLSPTVLLYERPKELQKDESTCPKLILIASWMDARDVHIAKYIAGYKSMYPTASILVVKSSFRHYLSPKTCARETAPAAEAIRNILPLGVDSTPSMIVHMFSNGGSCVLYTLYDIYREMVMRSAGNLNEHDILLPPHVTIYDSVPGGWTYTGSTSGILASIPAGIARMLLTPVVHLLGLWWIVKYRVLKIQEETERWANAHNDTGLVREACRSYIYSTADNLVDYRVVEKHAEQARFKGFTVALMERYTDSAHVAHVRTYPERYWRVVEKSWDTGTRALL